MARKTVLQQLDHNQIAVAPDDLSDHAHQQNVHLAEDIQGANDHHYGSNGNPC